MQIVLLVITVNIAIILWWLYSINGKLDKIIKLIDQEEQL